MHAFSLSLSSLILRFNLMMAIVIVAGFAGIWPLALLALPVVLTCILGVRFPAVRLAALVPRFRRHPGKATKVVQLAPRAVPAHAA